MNEPMFRRDVDASGAARRRFVPCPTVSDVPAASAAIDPVSAPTLTGWRSILLDALGLGRPGLGDTI